MSVPRYQSTQCQEPCNTQLLFTIMRPELRGSRNGIVWHLVSVDVPGMRKLGQSIVNIYISLWEILCDISQFILSVKLEFTDLSGSMTRQPRRMRMRSCCVIIRAFPQNNVLAPIVNTNTIKISYRTLQNMGGEISQHNKNILGGGVETPARTSVLPGHWCCPALSTIQTNVCARCAWREDSSGH